MISQQVSILMVGPSRTVDGELLEVNDRDVAVAVSASPGSIMDTVFYPWQAIHWLSLNESDEREFREAKRTGAQRPLGALLVRCL
jgi:hypothetical protein